MSDSKKCLAGGRACVSDPDFESSHTMSAQFDSAPFPVLDRSG